MERHGERLLSFRLSDPDPYEPMKTLCPSCGCMSSLFPEIEGADLPAMVKNELQYFVWTLNTREGLPVDVPSRLRVYESLMLQCYRPGSCCIAEGWHCCGYLFRRCGDEWCQRGSSVTGSGYLGVRYVMDGIDDRGRN